jgi:hypothetical protein
MKTVIEMAREAAAVHGHTFKAVPSPETIEFITAFAELVRADERARMATDKSKEVLKLALENSMPSYMSPEWTLVRNEDIAALREALANEALDKMAENERQLGIQMRPEEPRAWFTTDELNAWADQKLKENPQWAEQPAPVQQEPAFYGFMCEEECCVNICYTPSAPGGPNNELPTAYYTSPPAQRTWVDLTDGEVADCIKFPGRNLFARDGTTSQQIARAIEAKLKEKNQ